MIVGNACLHHRLRSIRGFLSYTDWLELPAMRRVSHVSEDMLEQYSFDVLKVSQARRFVAALAIS